VRFRFLMAVSINMTAFWDVAPCNLVDVAWRFISLIMVVVRTSEKSVCFNETTRHYIPKICHLNLQLSYVVETLPITVAARSRAWILTACISGSWVWIPINALMFVLVFCAVLSYFPIQGVLPTADKQGSETSRRDGLHSSRTVEPQRKKESWNAVIK
jgi:hypothetical protein